MNFYKHHIGDYAQATAHLSFVEDAAYSRLIRKYYADERPLPAELKAVQRLVGARTREEKDAVSAVLDEFFDLQEDGWHNRRCDAELAENAELSVEREAKAENERERQRRHREERKRLFERLRARDIVPAWDTKTETLRALIQEADRNAGVTVTGSEQSPPVTQPVTRTATANQTPVPNTQTPDLREEGENNGSDQTGGPSPRPSMATAVCLALKAEGIGTVSPGHPRLIALIAAGAEVQHFVDTARTAKVKRFEYILATVEGQLADAKALAAAGRASTPTNGSSGGSARAARMAEAVPNLARRPAQDANTFDMEATDVTPRKLG